MQECFRDGMELHYWAKETSLYALKALLYTLKHGCVPADHASLAVPKLEIQKFRVVPGFRVFDFLRPQYQVGDWTLQRERPGCW